MSGALYRQLRATTNHPATGSPPRERGMCGGDGCVGLRPPLIPVRSPVLEIVVLAEYVVFGSPRHGTDTVDLQGAFGGLMDSVAWPCGVGTSPGRDPCSDREGELSQRRSATCGSSGAGACLLRIIYRYAPNYCASRPHGARGPARASSRGRPVASGSRCDVTHPKITGYDRKSSKVAEARGAR